MKFLNSDLEELHQMSTEELEDYLIIEENAIRKLELDIRYHKQKIDIIYEILRIRTIRIMVAQALDNSRVGKIENINNRRSEVVEQLLDEGIDPEDIEAWIDVYMSLPKLPRPNGFDWDTYNLSQH